MSGILLLSVYPVLYSESMTYRKALRQSMLAVIVGIACLVIGFTLGHNSPNIPVGGIEQVSAQDLSPTGL